MPCRQTAGEVVKQTMFLLFAFNNWYPQGGINDLLGIFLSLDEAKTAFQGDWEIAQIVKVENGCLYLVATGTANPNARPRRIHWEPVEVPLPLAAITHSRLSA